jgi:hypothetical protein
MVACSCSRIHANYIRDDVQSPACQGIAWHRHDRSPVVADSNSSAGSNQKRLRLALLVNNQKVRYSRLSGTVRTPSTVRFPVASLAA